MPAAPKAEYPVMLFADQDAWSAWLDRHHAAAPGVWLRLAKKAAALTSLSYAEALEAALCYGWIDGQKMRFDEESWLQKFTPRRRKSAWSRINREKAEALIRSGRMRPAGLAAVEGAREDGRWDRAYDSAARASVPDDLQAALDRHPAAKEFFSTLKGPNRYAILYRIQTAAKPETRARRIEQFVEMLTKGETLFP